MTCAICQLALLADEEKQWLPCSHLFHRECIDSYASAHNEHFADMPCPECRLIPSGEVAEGRADASDEEEDEGPEEIEDASEGSEEIEDASDEGEDEGSGDDGSVAAGKGKASGKDGAGKASGKDGKGKAKGKDGKGKAKGKDGKGKAKGKAAKPKAKGKAAPKAGKTAKGKGKTAKGNALLDMLSQTAPAETVPDEAEPVAEVAAYPMIADGPMAAEQKPDVLPECHYCGKFCPSRDYIVSKRREEFMCYECRSNRTMLYRGNCFPDCTAMDKKDKNAFFSHLQTVTDTETKFEMSRNISLKKVESDLNIYEEGGAFLPLSVWATKGYDSDRIKDLSESQDIEEHRVLGTTYRVAVKKTGVKRAHGLVYEDGQNAGPSQASGSQESGSYADRLAQQAEALKQLKAEGKALEAKRKKVIQPVQSVLASLEKLKSNIKADKIPPQLAADNPIDESTSQLREAVSDVKHANMGNFDEAKEKADAALANAKRVTKWMKAFV